MKHIVRKAANAVLSPFGLEIRRDSSFVPEATRAEREAVAKFARYSMTPPIRMWTLLKAIQYVEQANIPGDIVECGVWRGGNMMLAKAASKRRVWLYDTFAGMTEPTEHDITHDGKSAAPIHAANQRKEHNAWAYASINEVYGNFDRHGLMSDDVIFRKGKVEDTLRTEKNPDQISVLRLDTDWYESTLVELDVLYPRLSPGGVLIVDDYGGWLGSKRAVDEYFRGRVLLIPVDQTCRMAIKI